MTRRPTITVSVSHGDLRYARYPLAVGHYVGDAIVSAEALLDVALDGTLRQHFNLGVYPGPLETSHIVQSPSCHPPGAIVVGLGKVGELTPLRLRQSFSAALRKYALLQSEAPRSDTAQQKTGVRFSSLLVGSDGGALGSLSDFIHAIVRGAVDANRALRHARLETRIDCIEFVELYEDMAIAAGQIIANLPGPLAQELGADEGVVGQKCIDVLQGGRFLRPTNPYASGWWQRIAVRRKVESGAAPAALQPDTATSLQFTVLTDRARLEQELSVEQRALITELITKATGTPTVDLSLSAALYLLVVPDHIRDRIAAGGDLLFMVDRAGAGYPFELMAERTVEEPQPLADSRGILRQFETDIFRERVEMARADQIFILGNPKTLLWPDLPGAQAEAEDVKQIAEKHGLKVMLAARDDAERAVIDLTTGEYRILHLAAHGRYDADPMKSGVIVSDRIAITPAEVLRLPLVPELVFLNCCYLGQIGEQRAAGPDPRLGASLAEGFIQAGVRAVIAAGWPVADQAGRLFARSFYTSFLAGATFGDAVKTARDETRANYPAVNTWGAYQCYGNPEYRFRPAETVSRGHVTPRMVAPSEALQALRTMAADAGRVSIRGVPALSKRFDQLLKALRKPWLEQAELLAACGDICGQLEEFERAIAFYRQALRAVPAGAPLVVTEQLANLLARAAAVRVMAEPTRTNVNAALAAFAEASKWLDWLDEKLEPSKERWALRGSLHKHWAICEAGRRREHLQRAADAYDQAAKLANKEEDYGRLNVLALDFVLAPQQELPGSQHQADVYLEEVRNRPEAGDRGFWDVVAYPDALLHKHVICGTLATPGVLDEVAAGYQRARRVGPTPRQWASVRDQIWFLSEMTRDDTLECHNPATADALGKLLASLTRK